MWRRSWASRFTLPDCRWVKETWSRKRAAPAIDFSPNALPGGGCDAVATGHTLDDQAETVLARFLRGAGSAGLSGIIPVTESRIVRPLLELRRADIREWLTAQNIPWREDGSNRDTDFLRNRIRIETMPHLAALNPALPSVLASTAEWARAEEEYWASQTGSP